MYESHELHEPLELGVLGETRTDSRDVGQVAERGELTPPPRLVLHRQVRLWEPLAYTLCGFAGSVGALAVGTMRGLGPLLGLGVGAASVALLARAGFLGVRLARQRHGWLAALGALQTLVALALAAFGGLIVLIDSMGGFRRGRQLRANGALPGALPGALQLPPLRRGDGWVTLPSRATASANEATAVADQWRENGRTEHASVAAFARLSLDLLGLGAPAALLELAQKDGLDEIRHAELCFSLASALDGREVSPAPFRAAANAGPRSAFRAFALAQVAIDSLVEGALHEGLSARVVAQLAKACPNPHIQPMLREIAEDEGRHAAHAWDVLEWCLAEGGLMTRAMLAGAARALPETMESSLPEAARAGAWVQYGIHGEELETLAYVKTRASVVRRIEALLAQPRERVELFV